MSDRLRRIIDGGGSPLARDLLETARSDEPSRRRSAAAAAAAIAAAGDALADERPTRARTASRGVSSLAKLAIGVVFAGAIVVGLTHRTESPSPSPVRSATASPAATQAAGPVEDRPATAVHDLPTAPSPSPALSVGTRSSREPTKPSPKESDAPSDSPATTDSIQDELEALRKVRVLLRGGDGDGALAELSRYSARWPKGHLAPEAEALTVDAEIAAGHREEARRHASAFLAKHGDSPLAPRVKRLAETLEHP